MHGFVYTSVFHIVIIHASSATHRLSSAPRSSLTSSGSFRAFWGESATTFLLASSPYSSSELQSTKKIKASVEVTG